MSATANKLEVGTASCSTSLLSPCTAYFRQSLRYYPKHIKEIKWNVPLSPTVPKEFHFNCKCRPPMMTSEDKRLKNRRLKVNIAEFPVLSPNTLAFSSRLRSYTHAEVCEGRGEETGNSSMERISMIGCGKDKLKKGPDFILSRNAREVEGRSKKLGPFAFIIKSAAIREMQDEKYA
ncbi:unnamed protein product [Enterobius vermicularis]|uniref:Uncharacterized protein n=1 Tax=Enterobius vermicularis TaxID=51028 RepID=A0A0N4VDM7_ENTVE|nr:unnamed protein product [Enterobius vermicularis]